jgi:ribosomal protein S18 acetylase RimI-like enzyme
MSLPEITFRTILPEDTEFLYSVYANTRTQELSVTGWTDLQKEAFLRSQFNAQQTAYQQTYKGGDFLVILRSNQPVGRLYLARWETEIRIVDIAILPEHRNAGIGGAILKDILDEGSRDGKRVTIHVEMFNPALSLYRRLGFRKLGEHGIYHFMEWTPPPAV